ncbi:MAG: hypothetical protein K2W95_31920 [Candidatus Obscuribacterales bacterium]|nr:hypothetical protein [Candidatus Obscuribacterales bacterium]
MTYQYVLHLASEKASYAPEPAAFAALLSFFVEQNYCSNKFSYRTHKEKLEKCDVLSLKKLTSLQHDLVLTESDLEDLPATSDIKPRNALVITDKFGAVLNEPLAGLRIILTRDYAPRGQFVNLKYASEIADAFERGFNCACGAELCYRIGPSFESPVRVAMDCPLCGKPTNMQSVSGFECEPAFGSGPPQTLDLAPYARFRIEMEVTRYALEAVRAISLSESLVKKAGELLGTNLCQFVTAF